MSSTTKQAGNSSKEETSKSEEESGSLLNSHKITSFFPVLKPEGRAKISGLKTGDIKQKEILQKLKNKDTLQSKTKAENVKTEIGKPQQIVVKEKRANITVMSALKTPLSQVLRRSFESPHETRKDKPEKAKTDQDLSTDSTKKTESSDKNATSSMTKQTPRAKKSFPDTESNNIALTRSQRNVHSSVSKPATPSLRSTSNLKKSSDPSPAINTRRRVTVSEPGDLPQSKASSKVSVTSQPPVTTSPTPLEDASSSHSSSGNKMKKNQKNRKRHFRGATYNLFLSKKSKRKNLRQKSAADESKDDDGSVDDSSYFDSEDGNSLMSEDLYSASEKSLADEEHNPDSCNSPLLANAQKYDSDADRRDTKELVEMETISEKDSIIPVSDETSGSEVKKVEEEIEVKPEADSVKEDEEEQSSTFHPATESPTGIENDETKETKDLEPSSEVSQTDELQKVDLSTDSAIAEECVSSALDETKDFPEVFEKEEILNQEEVTEPAEKDLNEMECDNEMVTTSVQNSGDENDMENYLAENAEADNSESSSTIATCVKSRQRIKRRFTDDIVDTDVGLLSLSSSAAPAKRVPPPKLDPPKDIIQMFQPVTKSEAKKGPASKIECIYNSHQEPIKSCTCDSETLEANLGENDDGVFCQAVDSIDDKLVGCSNLVVTPWLVRSSVKIPFTIMCEMHLWRMKHHHSCPYCGLFCSQGPFMQCSNVHGKKKVVHLYHEGCQGKEEGVAPFCLHCGTTKGLKKVQLEMHMASPPAFFMNQVPSLGSQAMEKARMSFASSEEILKKKLEDESSAISYKIEDTGKVLSSVGLTGRDQQELDKLLQQLNDEKLPSTEEVVPEDFYNACLQGDTTKVLNMLAQGMDPNLKFPEHENDTFLHAAASGGHTTIVHLLIQAGSVNDTLNERIYTPLMLAVESNHKDVVFYLIKNGSVSDYKGENGMSSFHIAAKNGSFDILKILLSSRDIDINSQDDGGWTPIVWASEHDHYDVVKYLLTRGANPNIKDSEGNIGLHWSAFSGSVDISFLYLDYGCDINAVNERGDTPLHIAARQDALSCVTLFLSRGANVQLKNKSDQIPADCVLNKNGDTYLSLSLNMLLKRISTKYKHKVEKILHKDISRGKEQISIQCVNEVDDEPPPLDFLYVTENCETTPMKIDRTITSLQYCHCEDDCSTADCTCASISYQCWYDKDGLLLPNFNLLDPPMLFECNRACSCWSFNCRNRVLQNGITCRLQLIRTKGKGWGVRTLKDIPKGTFICEYVGEMISDSAADKRADDSYLFDLDNRDGETYCLDARYYGNISRFINHLCEPNLYPVKVYVDHQDLNFPRIAFFSSRDIKQYEELGFDYCEKFWVIKYKYFTCDCGSPKCKYSKDTIHTTLANYYRRVREEQMDEQPPVQPIS